MIYNKVITTEYTPLPIDYILSKEPNARIQKIVDFQNSRLRKILSIKRDPITLSQGHLRFEGISGVIKISDSLELEIRPKFIDSESDDKWKNALFLLSSFSKHGDILSSDLIRSDRSYQDSLYDIAGRYLAKEYYRLNRSVLRHYTRETVIDYDIIGEIDFDRIQEKDNNGVYQQVVSFNKRNQCNAIIQQAMKTVLPYIKDEPTRYSIIQAINELGQQNTISLRKHVFNSREIKWKPIYEVAYDIVAGMGGTYQTGQLFSPGFIANTWQIWEWLISMAAISGLRALFSVRSQAPIRWGCFASLEKTTNIDVYPDVSIFDKQTNKTVFLIDAKYKTISASDSSISRSDIYEAYCFCLAAQVNKIFLVYPGTAAPSDGLKTTLQVAKYTISDVSIIAVQVSVMSLSKQGYLYSFFDNFSKDILELLVNN